MLAEGLLLFSNNFPVCSFQLGLPSGFNFSSTFHLWWVWKTRVPAIVPQKAASAPFLCSRKRCSQLPVLLCAREDSTAECFSAFGYQVIHRDLWDLAHDFWMALEGLHWTRSWVSLEWSCPLTVVILCRLWKEAQCVSFFSPCWGETPDRSNWGEEGFTLAQARSGHGSVLHLCWWQWEQQGPHSHLSRSGSRERRRVVEGWTQARGRAGP